MTQGVVDRLSLLPDEILIDILSRLPIRNAITTGILSKRWRYLWTHITSLNLIKSCLRREIQSEVLPQLFSVHKLTLDYSQITRCVSCGNQIDSVFCKFRKFNIHELEVLSINHLHQIQHNLFTNLIFELPSLIVLELHYCRFIPRDIADSLNLSKLMNLKVLRLRFEYNDDGYLPFSEKIIKYCPLLEEFSLLVRPKSESILPADRHVDDSISSKFVSIDAPNLKYLKLHCYTLSKFFFPENSATALQSVDLRGGFGTLDQSIKLKNIFHVMSITRSLTLGRPGTTDCKARTTSLASHVRLKLVPNLVHLKCIVCCSKEDITNLIELLSKCPTLQVLILKFTDPMVGHSKPLQCNTAPGSLATLKRVVINLSSPSFNRGAFFVAKYLLGCASVLERLIINVSAQESEQMCRDFLALPRMSEFCQIELHKVSLKSFGF